MLAASIMVKETGEPWNKKMTTRRLMIGLLTYCRREKAQMSLSWTYNLAMEAPDNQRHISEDSWI